VGLETRAPKGQLTFFHKRGRSAIGRPYHKPAAKLPTPWEAGQKLLRLMQTAYAQTLFVNDAGYV